MWKNAMQQKKATNSILIWRMRTACWIITATYTLWLWNTYRFSTANGNAYARQSYFIRTWPVLY